MRKSRRLRLFFVYLCTMVEVSCKISKIIFHNPENGYTVLKTECKDYLDFVVVCKGMVCPKEGDNYRFKGEWKKDRYGVKLEAEEYEEILPDTIEGIEKYLASGLIKGIGPAYAKKIVNALKEETFNVIESKSERLCEIKGIGRARADAIWKAWDEHVYIRSLIVFLKDYDISTNFIVKIYRKYGNDSIEIIKENPYRLINDVEGLGFKRVDRIALNMGIDYRSEERREAGIKYTLQISSDDGHTYLPKNVLSEQAAVLLELDNDLIEESIDNMSMDGLLVDDDGAIYLSYLYKAETGVADILVSKIISMQLYDKTRCSGDIDDIQTELNIVYDDIQREGITTALKSGVSVITGGPGTGKTTILLGIIRILRKNGLTIAACAPTGKAAKRMSEITGLDAKTIHRLLDFNPETGFGYSAMNKLPQDVLIVDEVSMVNIDLMYTLLLAVHEKMKVIFVGDVDQLPAIGPGNVLLDLIKSGSVPVVKLEKIYRQAQESDIIVNSHRVNNGEMPIIKNGKPNTDFFFIRESDNDNLIKLIPELVKERIPKAYSVQSDDIQVLTPMRKGEIGSINLNTVLQEALNPSDIGIKYGNFTFRLNDKVMQIKNNYETGIFNGEIGKIVDINVDMKELFVDFDGNIVVYTNGNLDEIVLAYAMTIHKSQGSEYPVVIIPITREHYTMMQRNLIYTAITRAQKICIMVGSVDMVRRAVGNINSKRRYGKLNERISFSPKLI